MKLNYQKELTPVLYGDSAVKIHDTYSVTEGVLCFSLHWHERMEILLITEGELELLLGDRTAHASAGSVAVFIPGQPHRGIAGRGGVTYRTVMFDIQTFYNSTPAAQKYLLPIAEQKISFAPVTYNKEIFETAKYIVDEQLSRSDASPLTVIGGIYRLLGLLYRYCLSEKSVHAPSDEKLRNVTEYIENHFREDISSKELSRRFGYDEAYFCRRFKSVTGLSPMIYIQILRLEYARRAIKNEKGVKISEISSSCGFSDPGYFARCFKKHYGMTPTEYSALLQI